MGGTHRMQGSGISGRGQPLNDHPRSTRGGVGSNKDHIYLHLEHLGAALSKASAGYCRVRQDICRCGCHREPIPVLPTVHYNMGGIPPTTVAKLVP